jgi:Tol biopolymer transport system component
MQQRLRLVSSIAVGLVALSAAASASGAGAQRRDEFGAIVFTRYDASGASHIMVTRGGPERELVLPLPGDTPTWSPDGRRLVVNVFPPDGPVRPATINANGSGFKLLAVPGIASDTDVSCRAWSPDGRRLLCQASNFNGHNQDDGIYAIRASDGGGATRLTVNPYPPELTPGGDFGGGDIPGAFSPDGRKFVFMRAKPGPDPTHPDQGQTGALYIENSDGTGLRQIAPFGVANSHDNGIEDWSPDGRWIVFADANFSLQLIRPDGTGQRAVPLPADPAGPSFAFTPGWSPDGGRIVFSLYLPTPSQEDIYTVRPNGTGLAHVTNTPEFEDNAKWAERG